MTTIIKFDIPENQEPARCRGCRALIYWIKTSNGKNMPVDVDGTSHFATCPKADQFRHYNPDKDPKRTRQYRLFSDLLERKSMLPIWETNFMNSITRKFDNSKKLTNAEDAALEQIHEQRT